MTCRSNLRQAVLTLIQYNIKGRGFMFFKTSYDNQPVIDMHCHILPELDDGARFMKESLMMLKSAQENGIKAIVATPHFKDGAPNATKAEIDKKIFDLLRNAFDKGIDVKIYPGNEIMYFEDVPDLLEKNEVHTLNDSEFVLVEFLPNHPFNYIINALYDIVDTGYVPVLAHIERYECIVREYDKVREIVHAGARIQVNYSSVIGEMGREVKGFVHKLLKEQRVDYLGTDAHRAEGNRTVDIEEELTYLYKKYPEEYVEAITYQNAKDDLNLKI